MEQKPDITTESADVDKSAEKIDKVYDVEGLLAGLAAGLVVSLIVSFDIIFGAEIGGFLGLIVGVNLKKTNLDAQDAQDGKDKQTSQSRPPDASSQVKRPDDNVKK